MLALAGFLVALSLAAAFAAPLRLAVLIADAAAAALIALDLAFTPSPLALRPRRSVPMRAGLSDELLRLLHVTLVPAAAGLRIEVREAAPASFEILGRGIGFVRPGPFDDPLQIARAVLAPPLEGDPTGGCDGARLPQASGEEIALPRLYRPTRRGAHAFGDVRLRLRSSFGLFWRQVRLTGEQRVAVVPALSGLKRTLRLAASRRWQDLGVQRLRRRGALTNDFESLRDYVPGDDVRVVDWKATARRGKPTVRQFQVERGQELVLLVDCGRRMAATVAGGEQRGWTKLDHALDAALELAAVALQEGDRVGLAAFDLGLRAWLPPARGSRQLARLLEAAFELQPAHVESDLARALSEVRLRHRRRALLVVLSDVGDALSAERMRDALSRSAATQVVFAALDDPELQDLAGGAQTPGVESSALRAAAFHLAGERRTSLQRLRGSGARVLDALPAQAAGPLLAAWLDARRTGRTL
jgi:uncharacterized protein (DUF58 family)